MKKIKTKNGEILKLYTSEEVFAESMKIEEFKIGYKEEVARLHLVQQIREARIAKKYTQKRLAEKTNMSQSVIARIESGRQGMSFATISRIATILGKEIQLA